RKKIASLRIKAMINFITDDKTCRQSRLLAYFGEENSADCGKCDVCKRKTDKNKKTNREETAKRILELLSSSPKKANEVAETFSDMNAEEITFIVRQLLDSGRIKFNANHQLIPG
ncbi:MAG TPA: RecQ family zinc-binding domain-containing protein, partial [Bacteroidia bacterium]|nr:RecQ family zinc-binding domain-containing protein [Bacteroidia bacterium]